MTSQTPDTTTVLLKSIVMGGMTAFASLPFEHPFDALKTNMQSSQNTLRATAQDMLRRKGWRAFYNGFGVNSLRVIAKQAYRWPLWISISKFYKDMLPNTSELIRQPLIGFSISCCELFVLCPFERLKIWLMTTRTQEETKLKNYFLINNKFWDLYAGFTPLLVRQGLSWASFLATSQIFKNAMKQYRNIPLNGELSGIDLFLVSIPVAVINTLCIMPADCIKTFYQNYEGSAQKKGLTAFKFLSTYLKQNKMSGLYFGWQPRMVQYMIQSAFTLIVIEKLHAEYARAQGQ